MWRDVIIKAMACDLIPGLAAALSFPQLSSVTAYVHLFT